MPSKLFAEVVAFFAGLAVMLVSMQSAGTQHLINEVQIGPEFVIGRALFAAAITTGVVYGLCKPRRRRV